MRKLLHFAILLVLGAVPPPHSLAAQPWEAEALVPRKPLEVRSPIQDKNFYLLSLLESIPSVAKGLASDPELASITKRKLTSESRCNANTADCIDAASFTAEEIALVSGRVMASLRQDSEVRSKVVASMRHSGLFALYAPEGDSELLCKAWSDAARGINRILRVYGGGQSPRYPEIDSPSFDINSPGGKKVLTEFSEQMIATNASGTLVRDELWFQPSLKLALLLLTVNRRDEAGRYEPLEKGENAPALARLPHVQWSKYPYSVIVVPGLGPEEAGVALDPGGFRRIALAAKNYREGLAPYILVSGGNVHPSQTPFCEAIEMKKALITDLGIPPDAILVEPQARHTTTNLRNASRLLYRYRFPLALPALLTTDEAQTRNISSPEFAKRNQDELGYLPFRNLRPISPTDTAFNIETDSLQADSSDPLDP